MIRQVTLVSLAAAAILGCSPQSDYYSVVRTDMPGGYTMTSIQKAESYQACDSQTRGTIARVKSICAECGVRSSTCETSLGVSEKALWEGGPVKQYSITSAGTKMLFSGSEQVVRDVCGKMAQQATAQGAIATCVAPGQK
jgi:hypothetical protein